MLDLPLSHGQEALWFLHRVAPGSAAYNLVAAARVVLPPGQRLDVEALRRAFRLVAERHPELRATFSTFGASPSGRPVKRIHERLDPDFETVDATGWSEREIADRLAAESRRPFDLETGPLARAVLLTGAGEPRLLFAFHHIVADFWSLGIVARELGALYDGELSLPPVKAGFGEHVRRERERLASPRGERLWEHWSERLRDAPDLDLPADHPRPPVPFHRGGSVTFRLDSELAEGLRALARRQGATLFATLFAGFQALLARTAGQRDFVVGSPSAGRSSADLAGTVGYFVRLLALRADLSGLPSSEELVDRARRTVREALANQALPFSLLAERLRPVRVPGRSPLFQAMLVFHQNRSRSGRSGEEGFPGFVIGRSGSLVPIGSLALDPVPLPPREVPFDLTLTLAEEADGGLAGVLDYSADLFDPTTALRTTERFAKLLAGVVAHPGLPVDGLPLAGEAEVHQILAEWNDTRYRPGQPVGLYARFAAQAERTPAAVALVAGGERISYTELDRRARRLAAHLQALGVGPERVVGVSLERGPDLVVSLLGVLAAGGAYLPLDPANPRERLEMLIEDSRAFLVIHAIDKIGGIAGIAGIGGPDLRETPVEPEALAYVLYTSGSTGRPKGVAVTHGSASALLDWASQAFRPEELAGVFAATSVGFDLSVFELFAPLAVGGTVILGENVLALHGLPAAGEVTLVNTVPSAMAELLRHGPLPASVRAVGLAGEPLPAELVRRVREAGAPRVLNLYGPTEDTVYSTAAEVAEVAKVNNREPGGPPIGRPLPGTRALVLDAELRPAAIGIAGELWLGGAGLARGYLHRPDLTADRFLPDPFGEPGGRLYRTGDRARQRPDGVLELLGRVDDQVKIRGFRIELGEVEAALLRQPAVREAAAGVRDIGGERLLVAWVVSEEGAAGPRAALAASLPAYMVPSLWVELAALPRTPGGKVDRRALPEPERGGAARARTPPRDPVEEALAAIWREVLGVEAVGVDESFFELGGHSLLAMRLLARVRRVFGVELPVHALFERPTIALLAPAVVAEPPRPAPPLVPLPRAGDLPLSYAQERLWFLDRLAPGSAVYNMPGAFRLDGPLRPELLARAFSELARRHEALRTRFVEGRDGPVQVIDPPVDSIPLPVMDLGGLPEDRRNAEGRHLAAEEAARPFDLQRGPLLRTALLRLGPEEHRLLVTAHHIVADGWSMGVMAREVTEMLGAWSEDRSPTLPVLPIQYADFARWQREWLSEDVLAFQLAAWRDRLAGAPVLLDLPADRPRPAVQSFRGGRRPLAFPPGLAGDLGALARSRGASPFMVLTAGLQTLLGRYTGSDDLLLGTPVANRRRIETEPLIGLFVNTLVLRGDLSGDPPFGELLGRTRETALAAYLHQDLPFEKLVEELALERSLSHSPLVQVVLVVEAQIGDVPMRADFGWDQAKFDLTFDLAGDTGAIEFRRDLFDEATIDRMAAHLVTLLSGAAAGPERRLSELPLLTGAEQRQLASWNQTVEVPREGGIHERFERHAALAPGAVAAVFGDRSLTYGELDALSNRLARRLRRLGVGPETRVGLCVERSLELLVGILGTLKAGGAYVPLDPAYPRDRIAFTLRDARPPVLLTQERLLAGLPVSAAAVILLDVDGEDLAGESPEPPRWETDPDQLAYVIYTSGSTGRPKGTLVSHANVTRLLAATAEGFEIGASDVWTMFHSHAFDFSVWEIWGALAFGGRLVVVPQDVSRSPEDFLRLLERERVTVLNQTPSAFLQLARAARRLPCLRLVIFGGEALEVATLDSWMARFGARPRLVNMYGITETTVHVTWRTISPEDLGVHHSPIGVPVPDLRVHLLGRDGGELPAGVPGEMHVGGAGVGRGYLERPALTAERFVPDPFADLPGALLYRSGDLARRRPDGQLDYLGRIDQQVKIRGFRVELGEIEAVLAQHPGVVAAVVAVRDGRLVAWWVPREEGAPEALTPALRAFLKERLPEHMIPAAWVGLREMPLTASGKVDRRRLPGPQEEAGGDVGHARALTPSEEILAGLWTDLLGRSRFGREDDFFEAGGHSLLATQLVSRVRRAFGVELGVRELFEAPALGGLAERIDAALGRPELAVLPPIEPLSRPIPRDHRDTSPLPLSFAQQRLWLLDRLEPGGSVYNIPLAVRLSGPVDAGALERALETVIDRHEALRTRFPEAGGGAVQEIAPRRGPALMRVDLSALPAGLRERELRRRLAEGAERPFDLEAGPVIRALLLDSVLAVTVHHIASDGWSAGVLVHELGALYRGETLPALPVQYADFAAWQRRWLKGDALESQLGWWRERLDGLQPLELWSDRPRPPVQTHRGRVVPLELPAALWQQAGAMARRQGSTPFMALLAALQALLSRWSGQTDLGVGFPVANRRRPETEGLIGLFVNTLVLRGDLAGDPTGAELLRRTREATLGSYAHQDLPFERLVEELRPERSLGRSPLFQVLLALNAPLPPLDLGGGGIAAEPVDVDTRTAKFDLSWLLRESGGGLAGSLEHSCDLFDATTARRMAGHFARLLAGLVDDPGRRISDISLLSEAESAQLAREWNDTGAVTQAGLLPELIARQAERTPDAVALVAGAGRMTYRELDERAARLAGALRRGGVGPEVRVAVCLERSADLVAALLAVWKAGGAYVPLDPAWPRERLAWMLEDSGAVVAIGGSSQRELLANLPVIDPTEPHGGAAPSVPTLPTLPETLAYVLYTSGSTGRPKGVAIPHAGAAALALWARGTFSPAELAGVAAVTSVCFDLSVFELFVPLSVGGTVILAENALAIPALPAAGEVTLVNTVPSAMAELARADALPATVRTVCLAGEALQRDLVDILHQRPGLRVLNLYGPSEDTTYSTFAEMARQERGAPPIGRPIAGTRVRLLDVHGRLVPPGAAGELCLGGAGLARGYLGRPDLTAERFVPDPLAAWGGEPGTRLYRTGDLTRMRADGQLEFLGRIDQQVKVRGFRVEPGEVEAALRSHPAVREAAVVPREGLLTAWLVADGEPPSPAELRTWLLARLPEPFVPGTFAAVDALPLMPSGKVDRRALSRLALPDRAGTVYRAPRTPLEERVAAVWAEALGIDQVGAEDDFFALGGHSLLAARVASRLELPLRAVFEAPTVERLAMRLGTVADPLAPIPQTSREGDLPLSFAQERLWLLDRLEGGAALNMAAGLRLAGDLDVTALAAALTGVARRHEVLRTSFPETAGIDGIPRQAIAPPVPVRLPLVDLSGLTGGAAAGEAERLRAASALRPFDLAARPPWRALLVRSDAREHELLVAFHHIIADGWSVGVFTREVAALYEGADLSRPPLQYADFALWQRRQVDRGALARWRERLAGDLPSAPLRTDRQRTGRSRAVSIPRLVPPATAAGLRALARAEGASLYMVLLAALAVLLGRHGASRDVLVGSPVAGRTRPETEGLLGCFLNTLALRLDLSDNPGFRGLLARAREVVLEALADQEVPFERVLEEVRPGRELGRTPLFQVLLNMLNFPRVEARLPGLELRLDPGPVPPPRFDLTVYAEESGDGIRLSWVWDAELFERERMEEIADQLGVLLEQIASNPGVGIEGLSLVTARAAALLPDPGVEIASGWHGTVQGRFSAQALRRPEALAVADRETAWTYGELLRGSHRLAHALRRAGVGPGDVVAIHAHRGAALVRAVLGVLKAGAVFLILDRDYPAARLAAIVRAARPKAWLQTGPSLLPPELEPSVADIAFRLAVPADETLEAWPDSDPGEERDPDAPAYIAFTSGSTGTPKGIVAGQRPLSHFLDWHVRTFDLDETDRFSLLSGLSHDPLLRDLFTPLWLGASLAVPDPELVASPGWLAGWMAREAVTVVHLTPAMAQLLTGSDTILPSLRRAFFGGDALLRRDVDRLRALAPGVACVSYYGATETPQAMCWHAVSSEGAEAPDGRPVPLGRGIEGVQLLVLNEARGLAGLGEAGEIFIRTPYLALGYLDDEALTRERFLPNPFVETPSPDDRLYRTGDLGAYLLSGEVQPLGRADRQIKIRGFRVEPAEVEAALASQPGVREAAVVLRGSSLAGYAVPATPETVLSPAALRNALRAILPPYMVPAAVVVLPALPLTPNGKVDRAALPDPGPGHEAGHVAPRDPIEALLAEIWAGVLGLERVGALDDFFALGGHSLLATQVVSRVREACGVDLPLRALFEATTLAALARQIEEARRGGAPAAPPIRRVSAHGDRQGDLPLSFAQQRLWFLDQMEPGNPNLHLAAALRLAGPLDVPALAAALGEVVRRHESLRTTFGARDGRPFQAVAPALAVPLPVADLLGLSPGRRTGELRRRVAALAWSPFDLARGPLLRGALLRLEERDHVLLLALHHIVSDGWSTAVLLEELTVLYEAFRAGLPSPLPELPVQYADFASWQRGWMRGEVLEEQLASWRETLRTGGRERLPVLELPTDRPRPAVPAFRGARRPLVLPRELASALQAAGRERGATLFMVLMAAFQALLHRYTGQDELLVGSPVANRTRVEIERLIGMFFNLLAFRADLGDDPAFAGLLGRVRESALAAYLHQDLPFEKLLEELQPERHLSRTPLFQVTLVLQNVPRTAVELPGLTLTPLEIDSRSANFDLNLQLTEAGGEISGWLEYRTDLFDAPTVDRMAGHLRRLLEAAAADPGARISRLPLLSPGERFQLLSEWNDTAAPFSLDSTIHRLFEQQAARTPDAVAVLSADPAEPALTYRELERESARLARRLRSLGVGPGVPVGVSLERSADMVPVLLGVLRAGGFYVPLDSAWPEARTGTILSSLGVAHVLAHPSRRIAETAGTRVWMLEDLESVPEAELPSGYDPGALAYVIFTSGSTGVPKGVMVQHRPVINLIQWVNRTFGVGPGDRLLFVTSLAFDLSVYDIFGILAAGGTVRVASAAEVRDPEALARVLCREPITFWDSAPASLAQVAPFLAAGPAAAGGDRSHLRLVFLSGDWIPLPLPGTMVEAFPDTRVIALGGATEATVWSNSFTVGELAPHWVSIPYGRPIRNARYLVLDPNLEPCPIGMPGDLYIGGDCLLAGYSGDPELSAAKILPDPYGGEPGARLYRTGDRARFRPDGNLEFLGRIDHQVKIRGYRIELGEIEAALLAHPAVRDAVAIARSETREEDGPRGDKRLVAYVVQDPSYTGQPEEGTDGDDPAAQVDRWQVVYDEVYSSGPGAGEPADATLNLAGWNSSYTGEPLPEEEMRRWVESTVERILARGRGPGLGRVLEIGCGTGMLLFRIAPRCRSYHATDLSEVSLHYVRRQLAARGLPGVTLARRAADDWSGIEPGSFDAVILNSVTQHFPGADYLRRVVEGAVRAVAPGGFVFVGDVRSLPLLRAFHASIQLWQAPGGLTLAQLDRRVRQRATQEEELLVDPRFFTGLDRLPGVERVEIQLKRGRDRNEMSRFRFDAVLHVGPSTPSRPPAPWLDWTGMAGLREALAALPERLGVRGAPDGRLRDEAVMLEGLEGQEGTAGELRRLLEGLPASGVEPEDLWALGRELGYEVEVRSSGNAGRCGRCDALFWRDGTVAPSWPLEEGDAPLANNPLQGVIARQLVPRLRAWLADRVPEFMMPSAIVLLDALPLTANGKVDRRALPAPDTARPELEEGLVAPATAAEQQLAAIWSEVLGLERVGVHDNFFMLGGDSILSIQVIARAQQVGLRLSPRQLFQHQTIAELAAVACSPAETLEEQGPVTGPVPLTPIQRWFFEQELADPHQWNLAVMLEMREEVRPEHLDRLIARLLEHHDALRLRFHRVHDGRAGRTAGRGWIQWNEPPDSRPPCSAIDLAALSGPARTAALELAAAELQKSLDLENGPLQRFALFRLGTGEPDRLLATIHHLVVDGVSWRILLEDLQIGLRQLARGEEIRLPPKTTSYRRWAESLEEIVPAQEAEIWLDPARRRALPLPGDGPAGENVEGSARSVKLVLDVEETRALLREVPEAFQTRIDDVLLTALARAFSRWTGSRSLLIDLEGHGRGDLLPELDLSRTVGWFTAIYPVLLEVSGGAPEDDLKSVKEQLRRAPAGGTGYGLLRHGSHGNGQGRPDLAEQLARLPQAQVIFNNLGQLDAVAREGTIRQARESFGETRSPRAARLHLLEIYASVLDGQLELEIEHSANIHREATIRRLAGWFLEGLRELIDRCRTAGAEGVQGFTPSDFPEADLDQEDLDLLVEQIG